MKIVNIVGGLGNQMFVYAMFLALKKAHPSEDVLLCRRSYNGYPLHNGYELDRIFGVDEPEAPLMQLAKVAYPFFNYKTWQIMSHYMPKRKSMTFGTMHIPFSYEEVLRDDSVFYDGFWQNDKNFLSIRGDILYAYTFPQFDDERNIELAKKLQSQRAVSCHVRRGDYLNKPVLCVCDPAYYTKATETIKNMVDPELFCIFSDDIAWCKENLRPLIGDNECVFVDWNKGRQSFRDMQLMSLCHYNIIANSSFSWWGAWLNNHADKIVISPNAWENRNIANSPIPDSWIRIGNS